MIDPRQLTFLQHRATRRMALGGVGVLGATALLGGRAISHAGAQEGTPAAPGAAGDYPEVVVVAAEFSFDLPASVPGGLTRLTLQNDGALDHHAMFMRLNDDAEMADLEAALTQPDLGAIFAIAQSLGGPEVGSGMRASVIADLLPGQYQVICVIPEADGTPHYMMGMQAPLEVTEPAAAALPTADLTVELVDFAFEMSTMEIAAGPQIWEAPNVGEQVHELAILQLAEGVTFEHVQVMLGAMATPMAEEAAAASSAADMAGPPPMLLVGGVSPMNPGYTNWAVLDLEAGDYLAICFVPDPARGAPHFALGMLMPFSAS